jgi:hypothetical protein
MKVNCLSNHASSLSARCLENGYTKESIFDVELDKEYEVYAISIYRGVPHFLLLDGTQRPNWYPSDLFAVSEADVPTHWKVQSTPSNFDGLQLLIGYPRLIDDEGHYDGLLEREPSSMAAFFGEVSQTESDNAKHT